MWKTCAGALCLGLAGCATIDYNAAPVGRFEGSALVVWVGAGDESISGDGKFIYVPRRGDELVFFRGATAVASEGNSIIKPDAFYTDGGSIPRFVQGVQGFNAWAFGPAYIIHDWLFVVRKCINDEDETALQSPIVNMSFRESARIMAETIKTATAQYEINPSTGSAGSLIAPVTAGPISRGLWNERGRCESQKLTPEHARLVEDINRQSDEDLRQSMNPLGQDEPRRSRDNLPFVLIGQFDL